VDRWNRSSPIVGALLTALLLPRFTSLARRWLVFVPAGVVVHDQVVLGETLMVPRSELDGIDLAHGRHPRQPTSPGPLQDMRSRSACDRWATRCCTDESRTAEATALHMQSFIIAPTRPGLVVRASRDR